jgi:hypothetical protein
MQTTTIKMRVLTNDRTPGDKAGLRAASQQRAGTVERR